MRSYLGYVLALVVFVLFMGAGGFYLEEHGRNANVHGSRCDIWSRQLRRDRVRHDGREPYARGERHG